jgi:hypothetical protein
VKIPWIVYAGAGSHALPLLVAAARRAALGPARTWVLVWCGFLVAMSGLSLFLALKGLNNHWLHYVVTPIAAGLVLWALAWWQPAPWPRLAIRLLIPLICLAWLPIVLLIEDTQTFSQLGEPFVGLVIMSAAIYTLVARALRETQSVSSQDWFWIAVGIAIYHGVVVALQPASLKLLGRHPHLVVRALQVKALVEILAFLAISWGIVRPGSLLRSGGRRPAGRLGSSGTSPRPSSPLPRSWE